MTSLAELVKYRNNLETVVNQLSIDDIVLEKINLLTNVEENNGIDNPNFKLSSQIENFKGLMTSNRNIQISITSLVSDIEAEIDKIGLENFNNTTISNDLLLPTSVEFEPIIQSTISKYSEFRFPGLQICRYTTDKSWQKIANLQIFATPRDRIHAMLANDPLYLVGENLDELQEMINIFPEQYQRRVRLYKDLNVLPQNQFGLILCWDILNYYQMDKIEFYLREMIKLLRPGGVLIFSYNNCDIVKSAENAEKLLAGWSPQRIVKKLIIDIGYEIIAFNDHPINDILDTYVGWGEIKKPGNLDTVKLSQAQGVVKRK